MSRVEQIKKLCEEKNLSISEVLRCANVSSTTLVNWENQEPKTFRIYDSIMKAIDELSAPVTATE